LADRVSVSLPFLQEIKESHGGSYFVKKLIAMALDGKNRECEMASSLLSALYSVVRTPCLPSLTSAWGV
jgi:hypothetical protein